MEREELETLHGDVWNTKEFTEMFEVKSFLAPCCFVVHRETGRKGYVHFQHMPRYYFNFIPYDK